MLRRRSFLQLGQFTTVVEFATRLLARLAVFFRSLHLRRTGVGGAFSNCAVYGTSLAMEQPRGLGAVSLLQTPFNAFA